MKNNNNFLQFYFFDLNNYRNNYLKKNSLFFNTNQFYKKNFFYKWVLLNKFRNKSIFLNFNIFFELFNQNNQTFYLLNKKNLISSSFFHEFNNSYIFSKFLTLNFFKLYLKIINFFFIILLYIKKFILYNFTFFIKKQISSYVNN